VIRVGVVGATGRMGREVCRAVAADPDLALVAAVSHSSPGATLADAIGLEGASADVVLVEHLDEMRVARVDVLVDFTAATYAPEHIAWGIANGVHAVVGTTGFEIDPGWNDASVGIVVAPSFAIGAVLLMRFAEQAARLMPSAEVIELHHDGKVDAPSGTALLTARRIAAARDHSHQVSAAGEAQAGARGADVDGVRVHSVRLPGLLAHEEVIFGGAGQTLTLRHDSTDRTSFMPGVLLAVKAIVDRPGLTLGLEPLLDQTP
jgi:4-hydroxy-tetrahydrodipicolinate reductase